MDRPKRCCMRNARTDSAPLAGLCWDPRPGGKGKLEIQPARLCPRSSPLPTVCPRSQPWVAYRAVWDGIAQMVALPHHPYPGSKRIFRFIPALCVAGGNARTPENKKWGATTPIEETKEAFEVQRYRSPALSSINSVGSFAT